VEASGLAAGLGRFLPPPSRARGCNMLIDLTALCGISQGAFLLFPAYGAVLYLPWMFFIFIFQFHFIFFVSFRFFSHLHVASPSFLALLVLVPCAGKRFASGISRPARSLRDLSRLGASPSVQRFCCCVHRKLEPANTGKPRARGKPQSERLGGRWKRSLLSSPRVTGVLDSLILLDRHTVALAAVQ
jgi:hypothetical protein